MINKTLDEKAFQLLKEKMEQGLFPQWVLTDPDIYELEIDKIFGHTWQFLAHETELKDSGSYVTRWMVNDPVLLVKNRKGDIKGYLNSCTHRGTQLCTADHGNKKNFTCPYHGWNFKNDGTFIGALT